MIGRARLPTPPEEYDAQWAMQFHRAIDQNLDRAFEGSPNFAEASGYYGSFYDTTTQTAVAANTAYAMKFNSTVSANQVGVTNNSRITVKNRGIYNVQFSAQIDQSSGTSHYIWIWLRRNGTDISNSTGKVSIQGSKSELIPAWNFVVPLLGGDYIEIMWAVEDTAVQLIAEAATAFCPAIPSVIATVTSV
jgi:hypothetical protein